MIGPAQTRSVALPVRAVTARRAMPITGHRPFAAALLIAAAVAGQALAHAPEAEAFHLETQVVPSTTGNPPVRFFTGPAHPPERFTLGDGRGSVDVHGAFPNRNNPFAIDLTKRLGPGGFMLRTIDRGLAGILPDDDEPDWMLNMIPFGVAADGSIIDPSGPWYDGGRPDPNNPFDRACSGWEYEATHPVARALLGVPEAIEGHVQPGGLFHYHGYPAAMIDALRKMKDGAAGPLVVGYAADGYPIIDYRMTDRDGAEVVLVSGYRLRTGTRRPQPHTNPDLTPPGTHDGLFVQDFEYIGKPPDAHVGGPRIAVLDRRNGIVLGKGLPTINGYPAPHYAYVLTRDWPFVPRVFAFEPDESFRNIIPLAPPQRRGIAAILPGGPRGREQLYRNCPPERADVHAPFGRAPY
jgi:hypothetical protein